MRASSPTSRATLDSCMATPRSQALARGLGISPPHDQTHHGANGGCHSGAIGVEGRLVVVVPFAHVPAHALEQRLGNGSGNGEALHHLAKRSVLRAILGAAGVNPLQTKLELLYRIFPPDPPRPPHRRHPGKRRRAPLHTPPCPGAGAGTPHKSSGSRSADACDRPECPPPTAGERRDWEAQAARGAWGIRCSSTLAVDSTPGRPAPGWVPAPTR